MTNSKKMKRKYEKTDSDQIEFKNRLVETYLAQGFGISIYFFLNTFWHLANDYSLFKGYEMF